MGQTVMGNLPKGFFEPTDEALVRADEMVAEFDGALDGRLKAWFSIRVPVAMSDDLLRRLENYRWWWRFNRRLGELIPAACIEIQVIARKAG